MTTKRVLLEPAFVLHSRVYRDTSLLVDLLTKNYGRLTVVARGVRSMKSRLQGILVPFLPLLISFSIKNDLGNLQQAEVASARFDLKSDLLLSGFYLNELLVKLLPRHESYSDIYEAYKETLIGLVKGSDPKKRGQTPLVDSKSPEIELRLFEKCLLKNLGYGLELDRTISGEKVLDDGWYSFEFGVGVKGSDPVSQGLTPRVDVFCGRSLLALHRGTFTASEEIMDAKRLLRKVLANLLGSKILKSRELFGRKGSSDPSS